MAEALGQFLCLLSLLLLAYILCGASLTMATSTRTEIAPKTRLISRNFTALRSMKRLRSPRREPRLAVQLLSHRLLRWFVLPIALMLLLSNLMLIHRPVCAALLTGQVLFYLLALTGFLLNRAGKRSKVAFLPSCFVLMNLSAVLALGRLLLGSRVGGVWEPVER